MWDHLRGLESSFSFPERQWLYKVGGRRIHYVLGTSPRFLSVLVEVALLPCAPAMDGGVSLLSWRMLLWE